jgi:hypothetical protein
MEQSDNISEELLIERKDKVIHSLQQLLHSSLSTALTQFYRSHPDLKALEVIPISLSRFVYRELLIMSDIDKIPMEQMRDLFVALLNDLVENKIDMFVLHAK